MTQSLRILGAPSRYMQGEGAIASLGDVVAGLGRSCFVVADAAILERMRDQVAAQMESAGINITFARFGGECTLAEIDRQTQLALTSGCNVVVGMGGGKTIDTAKGVSLKLRLPIVIVPTIASNDSPTSRLIVVYDGRHHIVEVQKLPRNPDVVLVDTTIIAAAPPRFLIAGIGDALSKKFEAEQCALTGARNFFDGLPTRTALALCDCCYSTIRKHAADAVGAVKEGRVSEDLENTVEATVLLSGLGFESGGLALAHALARGMTAQPQAHGALHGELVAWGLLVQLLAEGREAAFIEDIIGFCRQIGLPTSLSDLGFYDRGQRIITEIAETTLREAPYVKNMAKALSVERLVGCIQALETLPVNVAGTTSATGADAVVPAGTIAGILGSGG